MSKSQHKNSPERTYHMQLKKVMSQLEDLNNPDIPCMIDSYNAIKDVVPQLFNEYRLNMPVMSDLSLKFYRLHDWMNSESGYDVKVQLVEEGGQLHLSLIFTCESLNIREPEEPFDSYCDYEEVRASVNANGKPELKIRVMIRISRDVPKWAREMMEGGKNETPDRPGTPQ